MHPACSFRHTDRNRIMYHKSFKLIQIDKLDIFHQMFVYRLINEAGARSSGPGHSQARSRQLTPKLHTATETRKDSEQGIYRSQTYHLSNYIRGSHLRAENGEYLKKNRIAFG